MLNARSDYYKREGELQMLLEKNSSFLKNEANPVALNEKNEKKMIEKNFFDQQIQVKSLNLIQINFFYFYINE